MSLHQKQYREPNFSTEGKYDPTAKAIGLLMLFTGTPRAQTTLEVQEFISRAKATQQVLGSLIADCILSDKDLGRVVAFTSSCTPLSRKEFRQSLGVAALGKLGVDI